MQPTWRLSPQSILDILLGVLVVGLLLSDAIFQPELDVPLIYVVAISLAALRWRWTAVLVVVALTLLDASLDLLRGAEPLAQFGLNVGTILIIALVAIILAQERQLARAEARHRQQLINHVERLRQPLTVILGYSEMLQANRKAVSTERISTTITRSALRMREILCEILSGDNRSDGRQSGPPCS